MTIQSPDSIRINGGEAFVYGFNLAGASAAGHPLPAFVAPGSHLLRGCTVDLELDCGMLFVVGARAWTFKDGVRREGMPDELGLADLFPGSGGRVFAGWFTGRLHVLCGEMIGRDYWAPVYERELTLTFEDGLLSGRSEQSNMHRLPEFEAKRLEMERQRRVGEEYIRELEEKRARGEEEDDPLLDEDKG